MTSSEYIQRREAWMNSAVGRGMNPDLTYGYQCVDVIDDYGQTLWPGHSWTEDVGRGNANLLLDVAPDAYWIRTNNNPNDPNQLPSRGDVIVWSSWSGNPFGHTGVVAAADVNGVTVYMQDGSFNTLPCQLRNFPWIWHTVEGWLTPRITPDPVPAPQPVVEPIPPIQEPSPVPDPAPQPVVVPSIEPADPTENPLTNPINTIPMPPTVTNDPRLADKIKNRLQSIFSLGLPTKTQLFKGIETVLVAFLATFIANLVQQPNPFTKAAFMAAFAAACAAIYALVKGFFTTL